MVRPGRNADAQQVMPRLFVGIDLPPGLKTSLEGMCAGVPGARWVPSGNFHLTLHFIGEVDDPTASWASTLLAEIRAARFALTLAGVGHFRGHTLWVGVEPSPALMDLQSAVETRLWGIGQAPDPRPYRPHVKLAKSRRRRSFRPYLAEHGGFRAGPFEVLAFSLIESRRGETGPVYIHQSDYALLPEEAALPLLTGPA